MPAVSPNTLRGPRRLPSVLVMVSLILSSFLTSETQAKPARDIAEKTFPSVVMLVMQDSHGQPTSLGSGFFVKEDVVATNLHVIEGAASGYVKIVGKKPKYDIAGFVAIDRYRDLVLLKVQEAKAPTLVLANSNDVAVGDEVYAVGNPQGLEGTFSKGIVSSIRKVGEDSLLQITAPISPGSSGGPVLNAQGEVVGVSVATFKGGQNLNFAIPSSYLQPLLSKSNSVTPISAKAKPNKERSILETLGGKSTEGVVATHLTVEGGYWPKYSFSFQNKLREPVTDIVCLVVFYDDHREPIDTSIIVFKETIPPGLAKRCTENHIESSVYGIISGESKNNKKSDLSEKFASCMEFRVLDFKIVESDELSGVTITPSLSSKFLRSHVKELLMNLYSHDSLGLNYYSRVPSAEPHGKQADQQRNHEVDPLKGQIKIARRPVFGIYLGEYIGVLQERFKCSKRHLLRQNNAYYELWNVQHDSEAVAKFTVQTFLNRVVLISIFFKDGSESNFNILKEQIEKIYGVQGQKPYMELAWEYSANLDGIPIFIHVMPKMELLFSTPLSVTYVHWTFMEKSRSLIDQYNAGTVSNEL